MSSNGLLVERVGDAIELAFVEDDRLVDFWHRHPKQVTGSIYRARVIGIERAIDGAFLELGRSDEQPAFLLGREASPFGRNRNPGDKKGSIDRILHVGQALLVQGTRETEADKGARVTARLRINGRFLGLAPHDTTNHVSSRIKGRQRDALMTRLDAIRPRGGLLARRLASEADDQTLRHECEALVAFADALSSDAPTGALAPFLPLVDEAIWQALDRPIDVILASDVGLVPRIRRILECIGKRAPELRVLGTKSPLFEQTGVAEEIERAGARVLELEGGGRLIIEPTAACTAIDVDGGGLPALDANIAAAAEIGLQARLRNLGGTIIVDFIDMPTKPQRQRLEEALRKAFRHDPLPVQIYPLTALGISQISRARRGASPIAARLRSCPQCAGQGVIAS